MATSDCYVREFDVLGFGKSSKALRTSENSAIHDVDKVSSDESSSLQCDRLKIDIRV